MSVRVPCRPQPFLGSLFREEMALLGSPLAHIRSRCTFARKCRAPGFALIEPSPVNPIQNSYIYDDAGR